MRMLPEVVFETPSNAERRVFELLKNSEVLTGATALHSLNCSQHQYKQWAEIDFCVISPLGIFVLEVKGGAVSISDGVWRFKGVSSQGTSREGPFNQARTARFALEGLLEAKQALKGELSSWPVFGFGVVFVDTPWKTDSTEMPSTIVADRDACKSQQEFDRYILRLTDYWRKKHSIPSILEKSDIVRLRNAMRPDVDFFPPFTIRMGQALDQLLKMTEDQYGFLEWVEPNPQIILTGGAGTGKTFLAMQCARMEVARGKKVAIVVESPTLAAHIRRMEPDTKISVLTLPQAKRLSGRESFDVVLVDEGQDLLSLDSLSIVSAILAGGMEEGRWRWFMDVNKQSHLRGAFDPEALELLRAGYGRIKPFEASLSTNVRNTKEIISRVERWTDAHLGETKYTGHGNAPTLIIAETIDALLTEIEKVMREYGERQVAPEEIGIVVAERISEKDMRQLEAQFRRDAIRLGPATVGAGLKGKAVLGTAAEFKGLERPVIVAVGFDFEPTATDNQNELYVATTRANYGLTVIGTARLIERLKRSQGG